MKTNKTKSRSLRNALFAGTIVSSTILGAVGIALIPTLSYSQDLTSGSLSGTVKDTMGKTLTGAVVSIKAIGSGYTATAKADSKGNFRISQIPVGEYSVTISSESAVESTEKVVVTLGSVSNYDFTLQSKAAGETVVVRGARRTIDFDRNTTGQVIRVQDTVNRIPVGRSLNALADLVPGISVNDVFSSPSISGSSPAENIYYINGMNITNFRNFLGASTVPFDFYNQVEAKTGGYMAEFGRSTGGAFIATSRSGSNEFHGGVNLYYTPKGLAETTPRYSVDLNEDPQSFRVAGKEKKENEATVWLSGPIWKDHITFFGFYNPRDISITTDRIHDNDVYEKVTETKEDPFWGGKLDFIINPKHRLEYTHIVDDQSTITNYLDLASGSNEPTDEAVGGKTQIAKYTGKFTDWFTLSALYGKSTYNQTTSSALDGEASVFENGSVIRGNPELLIEVGSDIRENMRVDADFYFDLYGKHHLRIGWDQEDLTASAVSQYSGGIYYRYYGANTNCGSSGTITSNCVRVRRLFSGGTFDIQNSAYYIQDSWDVTDRLSLNLGIRNDRFTNFNANGDVFLERKDQWAPRIGATYDVFGDKNTKFGAFFGRYYLPIAGNTNIRLAGKEDFTQDFYIYNSRDANTLVPVLGTKLVSEVLSNGLIPDPDTLVSQNLDPQYEDEYILSLEHRFASGLRGSVSLTSRKLNAVMEDADIDFTTACDYLLAQGKISECGSFGGSGYVLINPGKDLIVKLGDGFGTGSGTTVTVPAGELGFPEAKRLYTAATFALERPWDGKWSLGGSLTISRTYGNIEGGVKTDNGQDDTGLTQDFDEPGWTDGSTGLLPNHHAYSFKMNGTYQVSERVRAGFSASTLSPRKYGCIGYYPFDDGRAGQTTLTAWYCDGKLTPRGSQLKGDWIHKIDMSVSYDQPTPVGNVKFVLDVFNLLNAQGADQLDENGEYGGQGIASLNYGNPISYQQPRYVRLGLRYEF